MAPLIVSVAPASDPMRVPVEPMVTLPAQTLLPALLFKAPV